MLEERNASHAVAGAAPGVEPARHGGGRERPERRREGQRVPSPDLVKMGFQEQSPDFLRLAEYSDTCSDDTFCVPSIKTEPCGIFTLSEYSGIEV